MTSDKEFHAFMKSFGIPVYTETSVPSDIEFPWITYGYREGSFDEQVETTIHLWYYTKSEAIPNEKAREICDRLRGGVFLLYDGGAMIINLSEPNWYSVADQEDNSIKHRIININIEFIQ